MRRQVRVVLASGGRTYYNAEEAYSVFDAIHFLYGDLLVLHGACPTGLDMIAEMWAKARQQFYLGCPAEWDKLGRSAGMKRNKEMLDLFSPDHVVVFEGGPGSAGMAQLALSAVGTGRLKQVSLPNGEFWK